MVTVFELWDTDSNNLIASYERLADARAETERAIRDGAPDAGDLRIYVCDPTTGKGCFLDPDPLAKAAGQFLGVLTAPNLLPKPDPVVVRIPSPYREVGMVANLFGRTRPASRKRLTFHGKMVVGFSIRRCDMRVLSAFSGSVMEGGETWSA